MSQTNVVEKIKTHILALAFFFNRAVYEIMCENIAQRGMFIACWLPKATNTHSQYVIVIAFPLQQHARPSLNVAV